MATITNSICTTNKEIDIQAGNNNINIGTTSTSGSNIRIGNNSSSTGPFVGITGTNFSVLSMGNAGGQILLQTNNEALVVDAGASTLSLRAASGLIQIGLSGSFANVTMGNTGGVSTTIIQAGTGGLTLPSINVTGTSGTLVIGTPTIANNASLVTLTLPTTAAQGTSIEVIGNGAGGWKIAQNSGQTIHFLSSNTTTGTGGSLASTTRYDCISLYCTVANTDWVVRNANGNITIV